VRISIIARTVSCAAWTIASWSTAPAADGAGGGATLTGAAAAGFR
jgi:hypothetical protein